MPVLPSGRRIEFSLDRFHALLRQMDSLPARRLAATLRDPDDLLPVLDAVHFSLEDGNPYFADYVASDWLPYAAEWSNADRQALQDWLDSAPARLRRAEAIRYIKTLLLEGEDSAVPYPYQVIGDQPQPWFLQGLGLRQ